MYLWSNLYYFLPSNLGTQLFFFYYLKVGCWIQSLFFFKCNDFFFIITTEFCKKSADIKMGVPLYRASLVAQLVKNLLAMQKIQVPSLNWEDPLEKGMATHSSILAWRITRTEEAGRLQSMGHKKLDQLSN